MELEKQISRSCFVKFIIIEENYLDGHFQKRIIERAFENTMPVEIFNDLNSGLKYIGNFFTHTKYNKIVILLDREISNKNEHGFIEAFDRLNSETKEQVSIAVTFWALNVQTGECKIPEKYIKTMIPKLITTKDVHELVKSLGDENT